MHSRTETLNFKLISFCNVITSEKWLMLSTYYGPDLAKP